MSKLKLIIRELINITINTSAIYDSVAVHDNNGTVYNNNATIHNEGRHSAWSRSMKIYLWNRQILCVSMYILKTWAWCPIQILSKERKKQQSTMEIEEGQAQVIQKFVNKASTLETTSSLANLIVEATSHPSLFAFSEILSLPNILQVFFSSLFYFS